MEEEVEKLVHYINYKIDRLQVIRERARKRGFVVVWSEKENRWKISHSHITGQMMLLHENEMFVEGIKRDIVKALKYVKKLEEKSCVG